MPPPSPGGPGPGAGGKAPRTAVKPYGPSAPTREIPIPVGCRALSRRHRTVAFARRQVVSGQRAGRSHSADAQQLLAPLSGQHQDKATSDGESKYQGLL